MLRTPPNPFNLTPPSTQNMGRPQMLPPPGKVFSQSGGMAGRPATPPPPGMVYSRAGGMAGRPPLVNNGRPISTFYGSNQTGGMPGYRPPSQMTSQNLRPAFPTAGFGSPVMRPF